MQETVRDINPIPMSLTNKILSRLLRPRDGRRNDLGILGRGLPEV